MQTKRDDWSGESAGTEDQNACANGRGCLPASLWNVDTWSNPCDSLISLSRSLARSDEVQKQVKIFVLYIKIKFTVAVLIFVLYINIKFFVILQNIQAFQK